MDRLVANVAEGAMRLLSPSLVGLLDRGFMCFLCY